MKLAKLITQMGIVAALSAASLTSAQTVTLNFLHKWPEAENSAYFKDIVAKFEAANPNIKIKMEAVADEPYKDKIRVLTTSGNLPDVYFSWSGEFGRKFARAGLALDLTDAVYKSDWAKSFSEASVDPFKLDDKVFGIPINIDVKLVIYNKELFSKFGLKVPTTFEEFLTIAETFKKNNVTPIAFGNQFPWAASHYLGEFFAHRVPSKTRLADYELETPADKLFTDPGYIEGLKAFQELGTKGYFNQGPNALTHSIARGSFGAGRAGMMFMEMVEFPELEKSSIKGKYDFFAMPAPKGARGDARIITGAPDGFLVNAKTKNPKEAIAFLKFLTTQVAGKEYVKQTGYPSAVVGAITPDLALPSTIQAVGILNKAKGLALWLDTDMSIQIVNAFLSGSQALLNGTQTPEQVMQAVRTAALKAQKEK